LLAGFAVLLVLPFGLNDYVQYVADLVLVNALVAVGFNILLGNLGQLAFANTGFYGIGAYTTAILMGRFAWPFSFALLAAGAIGGVTGALLGLPALRLRRYSLALLTLAFVELLRWGYVNGGDLTNGSSGLAVPPAHLFGWVLDGDRAKYYAFLPIVALCVLGTRNLLVSGVGRAIISVRENEAAAQSLGIHAAGMKILAFAVSGALVGIAGSLFGVLVGRVDPESFDLSQLLIHFAMVMVGGLASIAGSLLGALLLTVLPELLRNVAGLQEIIFSVLLLAILLFAPQGLVGLLKLPRIDRRPKRDTSPAITS
jgi:branched-chain amino acid transport system permease protein